MTKLISQSLPRPEGFTQSSDMWIDEGIWGHRLHDEQSPWMVFLEFLNVFQFEHDRGRAFEETNGPNQLRYRAAHRLYLRNILFNNPHLNEIRQTDAADDARWNSWLVSMREVPGLNPPVQFDYLRTRFYSFDDFCEVVFLIRTTSLEMGSNKRWTSKFVFPYGKNSLFEDLDTKARTNDRRFFGRTGELLYLVLCRTSRAAELRDLLSVRLRSGDELWDSIVSKLQPDDQEEPVGGERANAFLPYIRHPSFDQLGDDWIALLQQDIPGFDVFPHLVVLSGLHLMKYQLTASMQVLGQDPKPIFLCEVVAPRKTLVRELSSDCYQSNNALSALAVEAYIEKLQQSAEWKRVSGSVGAFEQCRAFLKESVGWGEDYDGPSDPEALIAELKRSAMRRHRQHVGNVHRTYGKEVGLVSRRGTVRLRYAPTDSLLKTVVFASVRRRLELHEFLANVFDRYGLIFGPQEAEQVLPEGDFDKKAFQGNARRLEQRLASLGLLRRLSDGCAYVLNPFSPRS